MYNNKYHEGNEISQNNHLLMYLLQNRSEDFIRQFEAQDNRCFMGVYSLYRMGYANKVIFNGDNWSTHFLPIVENMRRENQRILDYLASIIPIPENFLEDFKESLQPFAWFDKEDDFEFMLDGTLDHIEKMGYRKIDCLLYEAGLKFNFKECERLLASGADPYVKLSAEYSPIIASKLDIIAYDVSSLYEDAECHLSDCVDIYGISECWEDGLSGKETIVDSNLIREFFLAAGCQLLCEIIRNRNSIP
ncbi:MAG: hypothetical protein K2H46_11920 [Muribaculaceae bacterium]|nr:hypothetical protein [Muribaculaceae bacterium]